MFVIIVIVIIILVHINKTRGVPYKTAQDANNQL
jgi:hypothetical protein